MELGCLPGGGGQKGTASGRLAAICSVAKKQASRLRSSACDTHYRLFLTRMELNFTSSSQKQADSMINPCLAYLSG